MAGTYSSARAGRREALRERLLALGLPLWEKEATGPAPSAAAELPAGAARFAPPTLAIAVCTRSHLPFARLLAADLARQEPGIPLRVVVADRASGDAIELPGTEVVGADELGAAELPFWRLAFDPWELCCALKPVAIERAFEGGAERVVYLDSDLELFASLDALLAPLEENDWVVVPHALELWPAEPRVERFPPLGRSALPGQLNAGLFAVRRSPAARHFLAQWGAANLAPGACVGGWAGGWCEQQLFAWVLTAGGRVRVLDDPAHDVAFWNLHEREVRRERDAAGAESFRVGGRPLASFHWSGFDVTDPKRIARHDPRRLGDRDEALGALSERYAARLREAGWRGGAAAGPPRLPSGEAVTPRLRELVKRFAAVLPRDADPWEAAGERHLARALLAPHPASGTLLPLLFSDVYAARADVRQAFPQAPLVPDRFFRWAARFGVAEHGGGEWFDRFRPVLPTPALEVALDDLEALAARLGPFAAPLGADRRRFAAALREAGGDETAARVESCALELYAFSALAVARSIWQRRADLRESFPQPLGADRAPFADWLASAAADGYLLPETVADAVRTADPRRARAAAGELSGSELTALLCGPVAAGELTLDDAVAALWEAEPA
jgi:hypothetical protein